MKVYDILSEAGEPKQPKTRNPVAHAAQKVAKGSGVHKDKKKAAKQGDVKHKKDIVAEMDYGHDDGPPYHGHGYPKGADKKGGKEINLGPEALVSREKLAKQSLDDLNDLFQKAKKKEKKGVAEEYDPSYDPDYRPYQKPDQDPDAWKQDRDNADEEESTSIVYIIDDNTNEVVLKFKSTGGYYGDVRHALKHGYDTERGDYRIKWERNDVKESATAGATSAGNVAVGAIYKNKPAKQAKNPDGTAKNALDMKANLMTGGSIKR